MDAKATIAKSLEFNIPAIQTHLAPFPSSKTLVYELSVSIQFEQDKIRRIYSTFVPERIKLNRAT